MAPDHWSTQWDDLMRSDGLLDVQDSFLRLLAKKVGDVPDPEGKATKVFDSIAEFPKGGVMEADAEDPDEPVPGVPFPTRTASVGGGDCWDAFSRTDLAAVAMQIALGPIFGTEGKGITPEGHELRGYTFMTNIPASRLILEAYFHVTDHECPTGSFIMSRFLDAFMGALVHRMAEDGDDDT